MAVYINSAESISPLETFQAGGFMAFPGKPGKPYFTCINPDYRQFINPSALRRMSKVIRVGLTASKVCLESAGISEPGAILIGSGLGCVQDTAKFLNQVMENQEQLLNPTAFIQSTHNTVSGQIALMLGCREYNLTFTQKTISFETALLDALLLVDEGVDNILLGGVDEVVDESHELMFRCGCVKSLWEEELLESHGPGAVAGEGAVFFVLSGTANKGTLARIDDLEIIHRCDGFNDLQERMVTFLQQNGLTMGDVDLLVTGRNGDARYSGLYRGVEHLFSGSLIAGYKHLVGEYDTASAFGTFLAARVIRDQAVPPVALLNGAERDQINRVLVFNYSKDRDFTFTLLSGL